tara:strand:- start:763 stop:1449 length:687 start_codon:yes stop_codon:yes gene_type:complete
MSNILIFDLDDTLYPELTYVQSGFTAVANGLMKLYGWDPNETFSFMQNVLFTMGRGAVFDTLLEFHGVLTKKAVRNCVSLYRQHNPNIKLSVESEVFLSRWPTKPYLVTDGNKIVQAKKIEALGLRPRLKKAYITHRYGVACAKPSLHCFELIRRGESCEWPDLIYVGDNPAKDFVSLNSLGAKTIRVLTGEHRNILAKQGFDAHYTINSINELEELLRCSPDFSFSH